jgi:hypothetical protein
MGHETHNWEWKFYKRKLLGPKLVFPPIWVINRVSSCISLFLSVYTAVTYIFTTPTCTTTVITLEPCALNAEFQHFILKFNNFITLQIPLREGDRGWKQAQRQGDFTDNSDRIGFLGNLLSEIARTKYYVGWILEIVLATLRNKQI